MNAPVHLQQLLDVHHELIVDLFAGGGGMSEAIFQALGRHPDIAINHNDNALSMHRVNHPDTRHFVADVFEVDPRTATQGRPVAHLHLSPDCTHHSQAAGGQPRNGKIRSLSWVGKRWAAQVRPRVLSLENVVQIRKWSPLVAKRCKETGRVVKLDGSIAAPGERVPVEFQFLIPDAKREGETWRKFKRSLQELGYVVEDRTVCTADLGSDTTRTRLYLVARCDGVPIEWAEQTHFKKPAKGQKKWRGAHEIIDFSIPSKSIFGRKKELADSTKRRIAKGIKRFVLDSGDPFIVPIANYNKSETIHDIRDPLKTQTAWPLGGSFSLVTPMIVPATHQGYDRVNDIKEPLPTVTCANRSELMLASPVMIQAGHGEGKEDGVKRWGSGSKGIEEPVGTITGTNGQAMASASLIQMGYGEREGQDPRALDLDKPLGTVVAGGRKHGLVTAFMAQMNGGFNTTPGHDLTEPVSAIQTTGSQQQLVTAFLSRQFGNSVGQEVDSPAPTVMANGGGKTALATANLITMRNNMSGADLNDPVNTITAGAQHHGLIECTLSKEQEEGALRVAAFFMSYYGTDNISSPDDPLPTVTTKDRIALVTVYIKGEPWVIVDIKLRMLTPPELYAAQGFPKHYIITHGHDGRKFTISEQVKMCGNSIEVISATKQVKVWHLDTDLRIAA